MDEKALIRELCCLFVAQTEVGIPNGVASLDGNGKVPLSQLPNSVVGQTPTLDEVLQQGGNLGANRSIDTGSYSLTFTGFLQYLDGNEGLNKVLTSDASGNISWQPAQGGGGGSYTPGYGITIISDAIAVDPSVIASQSDLNTGLAGKEPVVTAGTTNDYYRGDKTWQTLNKAAVGLANVDNTSDANKPISTATQTALNNKENFITAGTTGQYWRGDKTWQTLNSTTVGLGNVLNVTQEPAISAGTTLQYFRGDKTFQTLETTVVPEGTNLYWTQTRFDNAFALKTTSDLTEGTNLYYTTARFDTRFATKTTTDLAEGTNLYFTTARARQSLSQGAGINYNSTTGVITNTGVITEVDPVFTASPAGGITGTNITNWNSAYNDTIVNAGFTGTSIVTLTLTQQDGGTITASFNNGGAQDLQSVLDIGNTATQDIVLAGDIQSSTLGIKDSFRTTIANSLGTVDRGLELPDEDGILATQAFASDADNLTSGTLALARGGTGSSLSDPGADRIMFWDESSNIVTWLTVGANLNITGTTLDSASAPVTSVNGQTGIVVLTTTNIAEGTNLYYTDARFDTRFATKTTDNLTEGSTNLYFTDTRARNAVLTNSVTNGDTTHAPTSNAVYNALANIAADTFDQVLAAGNTAVDKTAVINSTDSTFHGFEIQSVGTTKGVFNVNDVFGGQLYLEDISGDNTISAVNGTIYITNSSNSSSLSSSTLVLQDVSLTSGNSGIIAVTTDIPGTPTLSQVLTAGSNASGQSATVGDMNARLYKVTNNTNSNIISVSAPTVSASRIVTFGDYAGEVTINSGTQTLSNKTIGDNLVFVGQSSPAYSQGKLVYDTDNQCMTFYNNDSNVSLQIGQENWIRVINNTGSTIGNGLPVYISGASGGFPSIALANANSLTTTIVCGLTTESIANGAVGYVTSLGLVRGINTSAFTAGATIFLGTTAGTLTTTAPSAPNYRYRVGIVGVSSSTIGTIHVTPSTAALGNGTADQVFGMNSAGTAQELKTIQGTTNRVTVTGGTGTITADIAATYVGQTSITTLGTVTTGLWNGTTLDVTYGGTGRTGGIPYSLRTNGTTAANPQQDVGVGLVRQTLLSSGSGALPAWSNQPIVYKSGTVNGLATGTTVIFTTDSGKGDFVITQVISTVTAVTGTVATTLAATVGHSGNSAASMNNSAANASATGKRNFGALNAGVLNVPASTAVNVTITTAHTGASVMNYRFDVLGYYTT